ncbi:MAG: LysM peptidoglycan-binding domain-containing protein [Leadbetterella sp.]|nr:LysM peptidoglycan-binding domain-containing protein [Leadbetterella sp.]
MKQLIAVLTVLALSIPSFGQNEGSFILHKVAPKETLYSLVKKYNTNFATVETLNPSLANGNSDIKVGQVVKFPKNAPVAPEKKTEVAATRPSTGTVHTVKPNETVFSISRMYNVDISNLVEANKITSNTIRVGEKLIVDGATIANIASTTHREEELRLKPAGKNMKETGIAEVINTPNKSSKYLALHRKAPIGSNIKITNEATGHTIVAKVIGNLNEKGPDENIMIKLSPYAYYQLRPKDARLRATVEYYLPDSHDELVSK